MASLSDKSSASLRPEYQSLPQKFSDYNVRQPSKFLRPFLRLNGLVGVAFKRQWHHPALTILALIGIILTVGLITSIAFFSQAVDQVVISQELADFSRVTGRPPFSTRIYTFPSARSPLHLADVEELAPHVAGTLSEEVGLPLGHVGIEINSGNMILQPGPGSTLYAEGDNNLGTVNLTYIANVEPHLDVIAGDGYDSPPSTDALDVWMHTSLAEEMGVRAGEIFQISVNLRQAPIVIRLRGFWQAKDPTDPFWFSDPDTKLKDALLVHRQGYVRQVEPLIPSGTRAANWHLILDESALIPSEAANYLAGFDRGMTIINKFVPDARLNAPPLDPLKTFVDRELVLTTMLLSFNIPAFGFLLYFLVLISVIIARWQRRENAILISRGMTRAGLLNLTIIEELLLFGIGYPLGIIFGMWLASIMGYTDSFLVFTERDPLPISLRGLNIPLTIIALAVALIARLAPVMQDARHSVIDEARERARPIRGPFWYRFYLDFLLIIPTAYAYRQLSERGSLGQLVDDNATDLYRDPLLILVPTLFIVTMALISMRLFPLLMRLLDKLASITPWLTLHLALRQLGRQSQSYINPLLLVIISLALGVYTLSMAASLDQWLFDRMYYRVGTDLAFEPAVPDGGTGDTAVSQPLDGEWIPLPYEFEALPGVAAASRVGDFSARADLPSMGRGQARFLAVDRLDFGSVAWFRFDFANEALGALMNRLAYSPEAILVSQEFLEQHHLNVGDQVPLRISINSELGVASDFTVVGAYRYFPTVYEEERVTFIGNLDYLSSFFGITVPHRLWLRLEDGVMGKDVLKEISAMGIRNIKTGDVRGIIAEELAKMERVGVFGTLSVGFLAATVMATLGLLLYSYASLQERLYRFSVLRAVGLLRSQILGQVILEYAFLTAYGAVTGAIIGTWAAELIVPFFRITGEQGVSLPPLIPIIVQEGVGALALTFALFIICLQVIVIMIALYKRLFGMLKGHWG
jgi:putative ABC transport system permease protein